MKINIDENYCLASGGDMHLGEFIEGYLGKLDELNKACKGV